MKLERNCQKKETKTSIDLHQEGREMGETLRNIQNKGRLNYSALACRQVSIYWLGFYVLTLLPSLCQEGNFWREKEKDRERIFVCEKYGILLGIHPLKRLPSV